MKSCFTDLTSFTHIIHPTSYTRWTPSLEENVSSPPLQSSPTYRIAITIITPIIQDWGVVIESQLEESQKSQLEESQLEESQLEDCQLEENQQGEKELKKKNIYYLI